MAGVLHGTRLSQPTRACHHVALLLGLRAVFQQLQKGALYSPEFKAKNPNGKMPIFEATDGFCLYESTAIARYFCNVADAEPQLLAGDAALLSNQLYPKDLRGRAVVDQYLDWYHSNLRIGAASLLRRLVMRKVLPPEHSAHLELVQTAPERDLKYLASSLEVIEAALQQSSGPFICETATASGRTQCSPTLVDIFCFQELLPLKLHIPDARDNGNLQGHPRIMHWMEEMQQLPFTSDVVSELERFAENHPYTRSSEE